MYEKRQVWITWIISAFIAPIIVWAINRRKSPGSMVKYFFLYIEMSVSRRKT